VNLNGIPGGFVKVKGEYGLSLLLG
jgi:hypothetical protein